MEVKKIYTSNYPKKIFKWVAFSSKCTYIQNTNFPINFHAVNKIYKLSLTSHRNIICTEHPLYWWFFFDFIYDD